MFKLELKPSKTLRTKFGTAKLYEKGYYVISSKKEGNHSKYLHRLIFEDFYGEIPSNYLIHHKDKNKSNNCILNLGLMSHLDHSNHHNKGQKHSRQHKLNISKFSNTSGYFRVYKVKCDDCIQKFIWRYKWYADGKRHSIQRVSLDDLEKEVKNRGLEWKVIEND